LKKGEEETRPIADYSIWYLQLPLKKKGEEETKKINSRYRSSTCPLYNYQDMAKLSQCRSFTHGHGIKCRSHDFKG